MNWRVLHPLYKPLSSKFGRGTAVAVITAYGDRADTLEALKALLQEKGIARSRSELMSLPRMGHKSVDAMLQSIFADDLQEGGAEAMRAAIREDLHRAMEARASDRVESARRQLRRAEATLAEIRTRKKPK